MINKGLFPTDIITFQMVNPTPQSANRAIVHFRLDAKCRVRIGDLGLSRIVTENGAYVGQNDQFVPLRWMAPESLLQSLFTAKSDVVMGMMNYHCQYKILAF